MPAPKGNENALKHGRRVRQGDRSGLQIGGSPKGTGYVTVALRQFRQSLENAVVDQHGEVNLTRGALINSACRWERVAALGTRWLRKEGDNLATLDRMRLVTDIAKASDSRDRCIERLKIDAKPADVWAEVYSQPLPATPPQPSDDSEHVQTPENAPAGRTGDDTGLCEGEGQG